jgi:quercetin dioxygenase-like cupin family protein
MVTPDCGAAGLINGFTTIPPGGSIPLHYHNVEESVLVLAGRATVEIGGTREVAQAGDVVWVPAEVPHRFLNEGSEVLKIFWTYAGAGATRTLTATGETRRVAIEHGGR